MKLGGKTPLTLESGPEGALTPTHKALAAICGVLLLAMMALTVVDVIGRYVLNSPLPGATELTGLVLAAVIFIGLPAACLDDDHVTVDLVVEHLPDWIQPVRRLLVHILSTGVLGVVAWRLFIYGQAIAGYHETTNTLRIPVAPIAYLCAACSAIAALITLRFIIAGFRR